MGVPGHIGAAASDQEIKVASLVCLQYAVDVQLLDPG